MRLEADNPGRLVVAELLVTGENTGTRVEIFDLQEPDSASLQPSRIAADLSAQFCAFLVGNPAKELIVQGAHVDVHSLVAWQEHQTIEFDEAAPAVITHLIFKSTVDRSRFPEPILYTAKGQTIATEKPAFPVSPQYLAVVEWPYLEELVTTNREALVELDSGYKDLQQAAITNISQFQSTLRTSHTKLFLKEARGRDYYPFRSPPQDPLENAQQVMYDAVLTEVNQQVNLEGMTQRQQAVVFRLLRRALENEDLLEILGELIDVPDEQLARFRQVLSRTTIDSIVRLSTEVTNRLEYLHQLHHLIYGDTKRFVLERAHLHKLLEPYVWLFGEVFHLGTSDNAFRTVIARHRVEAGLEPLDEADLKKISGIDSIPDLFLIADKEYSQSPTHRRLLVEIKAPNVPVGKNEIDQIQRYADVIVESSEFDTTSTEWDLFLISADIRAEVDRRRSAADRPFGMLDNVANLRIWVFKWSEIISRARDELRLVREHLKRKATELNLEYWRQEFPEIMEEIQERQEKAILRLHSSGQRHISLPADRNGA
jgi:hypothetical protein